MDSLQSDVMTHFTGPIQVFKEYWRNPGATEKEFTRDGWCVAQTP